MPETKYLVVMGVSGSGKTTIAKLLAEKLGCKFADGDDLHPAANVEKMRAGHPLDDADRQPWLEAIAGMLKRWRAEDAYGVIACSALRRNYREKIRAGKDDVLFVYLKAPRDLLASRLLHRKGHFMPVRLLSSQLATLEEPDAAEMAITADASLPPLTLTKKILDKL